MTSSWLMKNEKESDQIEINNTYSIHEVVCVCPKSRAPRSTTTKQRGETMFNTKCFFFVFCFVFFPGFGFSRALRRLWNVLAGLWAAWYRSESHSSLEWPPANSLGCRKTRNLKENWFEKVETISYNVVIAVKSRIPKHLDRLVCLSIKTLAERMLPKGEKAWPRSVSPNSCGRW